MRECATRATPIGASAILLIAATFPFEGAQAQGWRPFFYDEPPARIEPDDIVRRKPARKKPMAEAQAEKRRSSSGRHAQGAAKTRTAKAHVAKTHVAKAHVAKTHVAKTLQIPARKPEGPLTIAISTSQQRLKIYDAQGLFAESPVSSGKPGHSTPRGVFSIIQKRKWHRSNIYANAPMPYMQRITWSGVALHAGVLPGYPASHGCVRLPNAFAAQLWTWTRPGARVVITHDELTPAEITHPLLASLIPPDGKATADNKAPAGKASAEKPAASQDSKQDSRQQSAPQSNPESNPPSKPEKKADAATGLRLTLADDGILPAVLAASASADDKVRVAQADDGALPKPGDRDEYDAGMEEPASTGSASNADAKKTTKADDARSVDTKSVDAKSVDAKPVDIKPQDSKAESAKADASKIDTPKADASKADAAKTDTAKADPAINDTAAPIPAALPMPPSAEGHIAMFISRKERKLFVRRNFMPWFNMPVEIAQADAALGTHVLTARQNAADKTQLNWTALTLPQTSATKDISSAGHKRGQKKAVEAKAAAPAPAPITAAQTLDRINLPKQAMDAIAPLLASGASLVISDAGLGPETGLGTDFIVLMR